MSNSKFNDNFDTYAKLLDGISSKTKNYKKVAIITNANENIKNLFDNKDIIIVNSIKKLQMRKFDLIISFYGINFFNPIYQMVQSLYKSLNVGGKFEFVLYPTVYDEKGNDLLNSLSLIAESTYSDKLKRFKTTLYNSLSNLFIKLNENELTYNASFDEIKYIFSDISIRNFLFDTDAEIDMFFKPIEKNLYKRYSVFWHTISGIKI